VEKRGLSAPCLCASVPLCLCGENRFMGSRQFLLELHTDDQPGRDCPVAARQGPPELELGPVRWPSSRCEEVCGVRRFMGSRQFLLELHTDDQPGRDCPVAARQGLPELELGPVGWPSSRCEEVCGVRRFMGSRQFLLELHTDDQPGRDCPVVAQQGPPELELGPVRWPSSRCEEVCGVRRLKARYPKSTDRGHR
jgi:hypothetical protein